MIAELTLVIALFAPVQPKHSVHQGGEVAYGSVIELCEGQTISLIADFKHRIVTETMVLKDGESEIMVYSDGGMTKKCLPRITCIDSTTIAIKNAALTDSGTYDFHVYFADHQSGWLSFEVNVVDGCPDQTDFYGPIIRYSLDVGALELLPNNKDIEVGLESTITLNVTIPAARPPVFCYIHSETHSITRIGSSSSTTFCYDYYPVTHSPPYHLAEVTLSHPNMDPSFSSHIYYHRNNGNPSRSEKEGSDSEGDPHWQPYNPIVLTNTIAAVIVAGTVLVAVLSILRYTILNKKKGL